LHKIKGQLFTLTNQVALFEQTKKEKSEWNKKVEKLTSEINKLETEIEEIKNNKIYENAFEWRFEFPEVLNEEGDFVGFDVVIGNPPYVDIRAIDLQQKSYFNLNYPLQKNSFDLHSLFIERGLQVSSNGILHFILPKPLLYNSTFTPIRRIIFNNQLLEIVVHNELVFEDANVETCLLQVKKATSKDNFIVKSGDNIFNQIYSNDYIEGSPIIIADNKVIMLLEKLNSFSKFDAVSKIIRGLELGKRTLERVEESDKSILLFAGEAIEKYTRFEDKFYHVNKNNLTKYLKLNKDFEEYPRLLMRRVAQEPISTILESGESLINNLNSVYNIILNEDSEYSLYFLCGILNSKISKFYIQKSFTSDEKLFPYIRIEQIKQLPIPSYSAEIESLVNNILEIKKQSPTADTTSLESEIDQLVYELYGLTEEEIGVVENA